MKAAVTSDGELPMRSEDVYKRQVTDEVVTRKEKERLEQYFQTVVKNLPGGVAVVRYEKDGKMIPEFLSDGFAAMTGMSVDEAWEMYRQDIRVGINQEDQTHVNEQMAAYISGGTSQCEIVYRMKKGNGGYIWVKNTLSLIQNEGREGRVYAYYHDITKERMEQERIRQQYKDCLLYTSSVSLENIVYGAVTGLASTGLNQAFSQLINRD